jgi:hypothetical protein
MVARAVKHLFFGLEPVIEFGARVIAALDIELVGATADAFLTFQRRVNLTDNARSAPVPR